MAKKKPVKKGKYKPFKFGEETVTVFGVRVPETKEEEYRSWHSKEVKPLIESKLKKWEVNREKTDI